MRSDRASEEAKASSSWTRERRCSPTCVSTVNVGKPRKVGRENCQEEEEEKKKKRKEGTREGMREGMRKYKNREERKEICYKVKQKQQEI